MPQRGAQRTRCARPRLPEQWLRLYELDPNSGPGLFESVRIVEDRERT
ncbi:MAG: hypothetical protein AB1651_13345 [Pseudomonadota bacterium]